MPVEGPPLQPASSDGANLPVHVAFIMDGNGRWAQKQGLPRIAGHEVGVKCIQGVLETLQPKGVKFVTIYAFSTENWRRPQEEVDGIMEIFSEAIDHQTKELHAKNVRVVHVGSSENLGPDLRESVAEAQRLTSGNTGITLNVAFDYGGRAEILEAVRRIIRDGLSPDAINEELFSRYLFTAHSPDPDLIIRTGGEMRISNFLLWQSAYSEYYGTPTLWPDLDEAELVQVLESFSNRRRRYGGLNPEHQPADSPAVQE
ncbi:MAG: di-trans,poly-cis-decaprenylcistransferase [SAR202 cluster bacterium Io17-Chloro-G6]|nr:MAG: di-trans,poly-cis-decaprenylcistransferase [SAR202 cluster bacterium Io17-Chloro-G6]